MNRDIILERLSGKLYHFTCLESLIEIINSNWSFELSTSDDEEEEYIRHGKKYFISFTRQKDYRIGFPGTVYNLAYDSIVVRIEFNGDLLNNNFEGHAVDYFKGAKHNYFKRRIYDKYQYDNESEDRLFSNKPIIEGIDRYITRIDILCSDEEDFEEWSGELSLLLTKSNMIYIYDNGNDFMMQNNNTINKFLLNNMAKVQISEDDIRQMVNESVRRILSEGIDNPWLYGGNDRWGTFYGTIFIGPDIFKNVMSKYQHEYNEEMENFENFIYNLESDPISVKCHYENSPSINVDEEEIDDVFMEDVEKVKNEISTYPNQILVKQALSVIDEVLDNLSIEDVEVDEEPEQDYPDDDY
jgi:hypothetical protein